MRLIATGLWVYDVKKNNTLFKKANQMPKRPGGAIVNKPIKISKTQSRVASMQKKFLVLLPQKITNAINRSI